MSRTPGPRTPDPGPRTPDPGPRTPDPRPRSRTLSRTYKIPFPRPCPGPPDPGPPDPRTPDPGPPAPDPGPGPRDPGPGGPGTPAGGPRPRAGGPRAPGNFLLRNVFFGVILPPGRRQTAISRRGVFGGVPRAPKIAPPAGVPGTPPGPPRTRVPDPPDRPKSDRKRGQNPLFLSPSIHRRRHTSRSRSRCLEGLASDAGGLPRAWRHRSALRYRLFI